MKGWKHMNKNIVKVDYYENKGKMIIFVNGYALAESGWFVLKNIAESFGQEIVPVTIYGDGMPVIEYLNV
ncbi:MAG: hypothetical protein ACOCVF_04130 [bacterium]